MFRIMVDVHRLQIGVDVERLRASLAPSIARLTQPSKWHVRLAAVSAAVDHGDAGLDASDKGHGTVDVLRVDRGSETEWRVVRQRDRLIKILHAVEARNRPEQLAARNLVVRADMLDDRRRDEIAV